MGKRSSDKDAYVDVNSGSRKIVSRYILPLLSDDSGFIVSSSSAYGENYKHLSPVILQMLDVMARADCKEWTTKQNVYKMTKREIFKVEHNLVRLKAVCEVHTD